MVALTGVGSVAALSWLGAGQTSLALSGAFLGAVGLGVLIAAGWVNGLFLVAFAIPLPALLSGEGVRIAAVAPLAALVCVAWAVGKGASGRRLRVTGLPNGSLGLLCGAILFAALFSDSIATSAREVINLGVLLVLLLVATDELNADVRKREQLLTVLAALGVACGVLGVLQTIGALPSAFPRTGTAWFRSALGFGQPNGLGLFLALVVPLIAYRRASAEGLGRVAWTLALVAAGMGLVGTFSRGSWLGVVLGAAALLLIGEWRAVLRIWLATAALAVLADVATGGALRDTAVRTVGDWVIEQRAALMLAGVLMFLDHPLVGVGPGGFAERVEEYAPLVPELYDLQPTPHNALIQMAAEAGIVGLLASVVVAVAIFRIARRHALAASDPAERKRLQALLWSLGTIAVASMAMWPLAHGTGEAVVLVVALACARPSVRQSAPAGSGGREWPAG
jgi:O-antigen ligase